MRVEDFVTHRNGITVSAHGSAGTMDERGMALIAADGLWSHARARARPRRAAALCRPRRLARPGAGATVAPEFREPLIHLWLGRDAHLVHYPVKAGSVINLVAITADRWHAAGLERAGKPRRAGAAACRRGVGAAGARARRPARGLAEMGAL